MQLSGARSSELGRTLGALSRKSQESVGQVVTLNEELTCSLGFHLAKALEVFECQVLKKFFRDRPGEEICDLLGNWVQEFVYAHNEYRARLKGIFDDLRGLFEHMNLTRPFLEHTASTLVSFPKSYSELAKGRYREIRDAFNNLPSSQALLGNQQLFTTPLNLNPLPDYLPDQNPREESALKYKTQWGYSQSRVKDLDYFPHPNLDELKRKLQLVEAELKTRDHKIDILEKDNLAFLQRLQAVKGGDNHQSRDPKRESSAWTSAKKSTHRHTEDLENSEMKNRQVKEENKTLAAENLELQKKIKRQNELILTLQLRADLDTTPSDSIIEHHQHHGNNTHHGTGAETITRSIAHSRSSAHFLDTGSRVLAYLPVHAEEPAPLSNRHERRRSEDNRASHNSSQASDKLFNQRIQHKLNALSTQHSLEIEEIRNLHRNEVVLLKQEIKNLKDRIVEEKERQVAEIAKFREVNNKLVEKEIEERIKEVESKALRTLAVKDNEFATERQSHQETVKLLTSQVRALQISLKEFQDANKQFIHRESQVKKKLKDEEIVLQDIEELRMQYEEEKKNLKELHKLERESALNARVKELQASFAQKIQEKDSEIISLRRSLHGDWELKLSELQANNSSLERRLKAKSTQISGLEDEVADLRRRLNEVNSEGPSLGNQDREADLLTQLGLYQTKIGELGTQLVRAEAQVSSLTQTNESLQIKLKALEEAKANLEKNSRYDYDRTSKESDEFRRRLEEERRFYEDERKKTEEEYRRREADLRKRAEEEIRELHDRLDNHGNEQRRNLDSKLLDLETVIAKRNREMIQLKNDHQIALTDMQRKCDTSVQTLTLELSLIKAKLEAREKDARDKEREYKDREQVLKREVEAAKDSEKRRVEDILREKSKSEEYFRDRERDRERERLKLIAECDRITQNLKDTEGALKRRDEELRSFQIRLGEEVEAAKRVSSSSEYLNKQLVFELQTKLTEVQGESARKLASMEREHSAALASLQIELEYSKNLTSDLSSAKQGLINQYESKKKEYESNISALEREVLSLREEIERLNKALNTSQYQLIQLETKRQEQANDYLDQITKLKDSSDSYRRMAEDFSAKFTNLQGELENLTNVNATLTQECTDLKQRLEEALNQLHEEKEITVDLREQLKNDKITFGNKIQEFSIELARHKEIIQNRMSEMKSLKDLRESELQGFTQTVSEFNQQMEQERLVFNDQLKTLDKEKRKQLELLNSRIHELVAQQDIQKVQLKRDLEAEKADRLKLQAEFSMRNTQMSKQINDYTREIEKLKFENLDLRSNLEEPKRPGFDHLSNIDMDDRSAEKSYVDPFKIPSRSRGHSSGKKPFTGKPPLDGGHKVHMRSFTQVTNKNRDSLSPDRIITENVETRGRSGTGPLNPIRLTEFEPDRQGFSTSAFVTTQVTKINLQANDQPKPAVAESISSGNVSNRIIAPLLPPVKSEKESEKGELDPQNNSFGTREGKDLFDSFVKKSHITTSAIIPPLADDGIRPKEFSIDRRQPSSPTKSRRPIRVIHPLMPVDAVELMDRLKGSPKLQSVSMPQGGIEHIAMHRNGLLVYNADSKLQIGQLNFDHKSVKTLQSDDEINFSFVEAQFSEDGQSVFLTLEGTFDLVQIDTSLRELRRLEGSPATTSTVAEILRDTRQYRRIKQPGGKHILWTSSPTSLCVVDTENLKKLELSNFFGGSVAVMVAVTPDSKRFIGVGETSSSPSVERTQTVHWLDVPGGGVQGSIALSSLSNLSVRTACCLDYWPESPNPIILAGSSLGNQGGIDLLLQTSIGPERAFSVQVPKTVTTLFVWSEQKALLAGSLDSVRVYFMRTNTTPSLELVREYSIEASGTPVRDMWTLGSSLFCEIGQTLVNLDVLKHKSANLHHKAQLPQENLHTEELSPTSVVVSRLTDRITWMKLVDRTLLFRAREKLVVIRLSEGSENLNFESLPPGLTVPFQELTMAKNGRFLYITSAGNVLRVATKDLATIATQTPLGREEQSVENLPFLNLNAESGLFLWPMGQGVLGVVDTETLEIQQVSALGGLGQGQSLCYLSLSALGGSKLLTVSMPNSSLSVPFLSYFQRHGGGDRAITVCADQIDSRLTSISSVEATQEGNFFLLTGKIEKTPVILAVTLDGYFNLAATLPQDQEVHAIRRISDKNIFAIGGTGRLTFVQFVAALSGTSLMELSSQILAEIEVISRIEVIDNKLFLLDRHGDKLITVSFPRNLSDAL